MGQPRIQAGVSKVQSFADVQAQPNYQKLPSDVQTQIALDYFDKRVATQPGYQQAPAEAQQAMRQDFQTKYNVQEPAAYQPSIQAPAPVQMTNKSFFGIPLSGPTVDDVEAEVRARNQPVDVMKAAALQGYPVVNDQLGFGRGVAHGVSSQIKGATLGYANPYAQQGPLTEAQKFGVGANEFMGSVLPMELSAGAFDQGAKYLGRKLLPYTTTAAIKGGLSTYASRPAMNALTQIQRTGLGGEALRSALGFGSYEFLGSNPENQWDIGKRLQKGAIGAAIGGALPVAGKYAGDTLASGAKVLKSTIKAVGDVIQPKGMWDARITPKMQETARRLLEAAQLPGLNAKEVDHLIAEADKFFEGLRTGKLLKSDKAEKTLVAMENRSKFRLMLEKKKPTPAKASASKSLPLPSEPSTLQATVKKTSQKPAHTATEPTPTATILPSEPSPKMVTVSTTVKRKVKNFTPDVQAELDRLDAEHAAYKKRVTESPIHDTAQKNKNIKANAMSTAAKKRAVVQGDSLINMEANGGLTGKELKAIINREKSNYIGKPVTVNGQPGTVENVAYGKVKVKFNDGASGSFEPEQISAQPRKPGKPTIIETEIEETIHQQVPETKTPQQKTESETAKAKRELEEGVQTLKALIQHPDWNEQPATDFFKRHDIKYDKAPNTGAVLHYKLFIPRKGSIVFKYNAPVGEVVKEAGLTAIAAKIRGKAGSAGLDALHAELHELAVGDELSTGDIHTVTSQAEKQGQRVLDERDQAEMAYYAQVEQKRQEAFQLLDDADSLLKLEALFTELESDKYADMPEEFFNEAVEKYAKRTEELTAHAENSGSTQPETSPGQNQSDAGTGQAKATKPKALTGSAHEMVAQVELDAGLPAGAGAFTAGQIEKQTGQKLTQAQKDIHTNLRAVHRAEVLDGDTGIHKQFDSRPEIQLPLAAVKNDIQPSHIKTAETLDKAMLEGKAIRVEYSAEEVGRSNDAVKVTAKGNAKVQTTDFTPTFWNKTKDGKVLVQGYNQNGHFVSLHLEPSANGSQILKVGKMVDRAFTGEYPNVYAGPKTFNAKDVLGRGIRSEEGIIKTSEALANAEAFGKLFKPETIKQFSKSTQDVIRTVKNRGRFDQSAIMRILEQVKKDQAELAQFCNIFDLE